MKHELNTTDTSLPERHQVVEETTGCQLYRHPDWPMWDGATWAAIVAGAGPGVDRRPPRKEEGGQ